MRTHRTWLVALVLPLLMASVLVAQGIPTSTIVGRVINEGQGLPGVTVTAKSPALQGTRTAVTSTNGDFVFPNVPPGDYTDLLHDVGLPDGHPQREGERLAAGDRQHDAEPRGRRRRGGRRRDLRVDLADGCAGDDVYVRRAQQAPDGPDAHLERHPDPGPQPERTERRHDLRRDVDREPLHGQRRRHHRQRPLDGEQPLHRGRHPGDDDDHVLRLRRVRPLHRRRDQHDHEVGRQHVQRLPPLDAHERQLAGLLGLPDGRRREPAGRDLRQQGRPDVGSDASAGRSSRTSSGSSSPAATSTRSDAALGRDPIHEPPVHVRERRSRGTRRS